jgi:hypothetical protein
LDTALPVAGRPAFVAVRALDAGGAVLGQAQAARV